MNSYFISRLLKHIPSSIVKNHCEPGRKKSQVFKKNIKLRIEVAEDPQKYIFEVNFRFWVLSCIAIGKIVFFFKKLRLFYIEIRLEIFFEIQNPNKKWLEISVFENSIIRWVYKVVKEQCCKSSFSMLINTNA